MVRQGRRRANPIRQVVHVTFEGGDDLPILFANHIFIRPTPDGFLVSFAQSHGPYRLNVTQKELEDEGVPAKIICKLVIPHSRIHEVAKLFQDQAKSVQILTDANEEIIDA